MAPATATAAARRAAAPAPARMTRPKGRPAPGRAAPSSRTARSRAATGARRSTRGASHAPLPARLVPIAVGRTAVAVSDLADSGLVHRLTRGRLWIGALTTLLVGIVGLNVLALSLNASSSRVGTQADTLNRDISLMRAKIAANGASNVRVQRAASDLGMIVPEPGSITYLRPSADDAAVAAKRLSSGELTAGSSYTAPVAPTTDTATTVVATTTTTPNTTTTTTPATTTAAQPTPAVPDTGTATTPTTTTSPTATPTATESTGGGGVGVP